MSCPKCRKPRRKILADSSETAGFRPLSGMLIVLAGRPSLM